MPWSDIELTRRRPNQPAPFTVAIERVVEPHMLEYFNRSEGYALSVKRGMAAELAAHIFERADVFEVPRGSNLYPGRRFRIELTISDRGSYEHWLPMEFNAGYKKGAQAERERAPYGLEPDRFYE